MITGQRMSLSALQSLLFALAPDRAFDTNEMWQVFEDEGVLSDRGQMEDALEELAGLDLLYVTEKDSYYQPRSQLLRQIAHKRFWESEAERQSRLVHIREQSVLRNQVREFFGLASFGLARSASGFTVTTDRSEYSLLGADRGVYVHLNTDVTDWDQIKEVEQEASRVYDRQIEGKIAFLATNSLPDKEAHRYIVDAWQEQGFGVVPLLQQEMNQATDAQSCHWLLSQSLQRTLGDWGPGSSRLDFQSFVRQTQVLAASPDADP